MKIVFVFVGGGDNQQEKKKRDNTFPLAKVFFLKDSGVVILCQMRKGNLRSRERGSHIAIGPCTPVMYLHHHIYHRREWVGEVGQWLAIEEEEEEQR